MAKRVTYRLGKDIAAGEVLRDGQGRLVDDDYARVAVEDALAQVRGRGRPSLSASGESPLLRVRISNELDEAVRRAAETAGTSRAEWVRRVLDDAVSQAG
jgi:predicted HicB family RNase H-like nuclease